MIAHVTVHTAKLEETLEFYQWLLDLPIARRRETPKGEIVFLGAHETKFELIGDREAKPIDAKGMVIGFVVGDLDEKLGMLDSKGISYSEIVSPRPGVRFAFFRDLNGCEIQLYENGEG